MLFCGCKSFTYNYKPEPVEISLPQLDTITTANVGDSMLRQGKYTEYDAIYLKENVRISKIGAYTFTQGYYLKKGEDETSEFYYPGNAPDSGIVMPEAMTDTFEIISIDKKSGLFCAYSVYYKMGCESNAVYEKTKCPVSGPDSFLYKLTYNGKDGNKINIEYSEYLSNLIKPSYSNEVVYDLSESNIIKYKDAEIEVIEATDNYIKYKVIQKFKNKK